MLLKTRGIVFRSIKYGDTSVIADIYTREEGLRTFIIGGVRKQKSNFSPGLLQVMSIVDLVAYFKVDRDMHRVKEMIPAQIFSGISYDVIKSSVVLFMIEVAQKSIKESEQNYRLFDFLEQSFLLLDTTKNSLANFPIGFLLRLSNYLGFQPERFRDPEDVFFDLKEGHFVSKTIGHTYFLSEEQTELLWNFLALDLTEIHELKIDRSQRKLLIKELIQFYRFHVEQLQEIRSLDVLETILS